MNHRAGKTNHLAETTPRRLVDRQALALEAVAAVVGLLYGYDFGVSISGGMPLGLVAALCCAVFCSLLADAALMRWRAWKTPRNSAGDRRSA